MINHLLHLDAWHSPGKAYHPKEGIYNRKGGASEEVTLKVQEETQLCLECSSLCNFAIYQQTGQEGAHALISQSEENPYCLQRTYSQSV